MGTLHIFSSQGEHLNSLAHVEKKKGHKGYSTVFTRNGRDLNTVFSAAIFETTETGVLKKKTSKHIFSYIGNYPLTGEHGSLGEFFYSEHNVATVKVFEPALYGNPDTIHTFELFGKAIHHLTLIEEALGVTK
jgi:hypothetical protein